MTILAYFLYGRDQVCHIPTGAGILSVDWQDGQRILWALVDPTKEHVARRFLSLANMDRLPAPWCATYLGMIPGRRPWFVFEVPV